MSESHKYIKSIAFATFGLGCAYILTKYKSNIAYKLLRLLNKNQLQYKTIKIISTEAECKLAVELLMRF